MYISDQFPSAGLLPSQTAGSQLCYTRTDPITVGGETYTILCNMEGSVVSIMLPGTQYLHICEVEVYTSGNGNIVCE